MTDDTPNQLSDNDWWKGAVFYQIYPRSFRDSNGDGIGDLLGITENLGYVSDLGVDAIWISPFYKSPMKDFGYDISDFRDVDPIFGMNEDFDILLRKAHDLGLKVIIDMVMSHSSDKHPWFVESRRDATNAKADWYLWADPKHDGTPPNNWQSVFGGPAWTFDTRRKQYYLHNFLREQPDLNFHNPEVQEAALANCRYWLDRGIDGFRFDVINYLFHDKQLRDNPPRNNGDINSHVTQYEKKSPHNMQIHKYDITQPENLTFLKRIRTLMNEYPGTMTLGEVGDEEPYKTAAEYASGEEHLNTCYNTHLMAGQDKVLRASHIREPIEAFLAQPSDSWPSWAITNHDVIRAVTRWGRAQHAESNPDFVKMLVSMLLCLRGTAFLYQGDELGLPEADIPFEKLQDPWGKYCWPEWQGRDGCRTPMPWDSEKKNAGFSDAEETWLPIPDEHHNLTVRKQIDDENSPLHFTRAFLRWRKKQPALIKGDITFIDTGSETLLAFLRKCDEQTLLCVFNLSNKKQKFTYAQEKFDIAPYGTAFSSSDSPALFGPGMCAAA